MVCRQQATTSSHISRLLAADTVCEVVRELKSPDSAPLEVAQCALYVLRETTQGEIDDHADGGTAHAHNMLQVEIFLPMCMQCFTLC